MYVCICNAIKEAELRKVARDHPGTVEELYAKLDCEPMCGQCLHDAEMIAADARASAHVPACVAS